MRIIQQELEIPELEKIQSARSLCRRRDKRFKRQFDVGDFDIPVQVTGEYGRKGIHNIMYCLSSIGNRDLRNLKYPYLPGSLHDCYITIFVHRGKSAIFTMFFNPGIGFIHTE